MNTCYLIWIETVAVWLGLDTCEYNFVQIKSS